MYRIGEFSKITSLTVKALRYYDDQGLLRPSARDESGYRLYSEEDYRTARRIALLRRFGFSIAELRDVLRGSGSDEELAVYLREKQQLLEQEMRRKQAQMDALENAIASFSREQEEAEAMETEQKELPAQWVLSARFRGAYPDVSRQIGALYKAAKGGASGPPFSLYYDDEYRDGDADIELCLPVREGTRGAKRLAGAKVLSLLHIGPYGSLGPAYKQLLDTACAQGLACLLPSREIYHKGPGMIFKGNAAAYRTEIAVPVRPAKGDGAR